MLFVNRNVVAMLRFFLAKATKLQAFLTDTYDFTECLMTLSQLLNFRIVCNFGGDSVECPFILQLKGIEGECLSMQQLLDNTLKVDGVTFQENPKAFIARIRPNFIDRPPLCLPQPIVSLKLESLKKKCIYRISAIIIMLKSHYTAVYRLPNGEWFLSDSMRYMEHGHSIPSITHVPKFQDYLDSGCKEDILTKKSDAKPGESRDSFHFRVTNGAYACVYDCISIDSECVGFLAENSQQTGRAQCTVMQPACQFSSQSSFACGGAAAIPHQSSPSFGHLQPRKSRFDAPFVIKAESLSKSVFSTPDGFFKAIVEIVENSGNCPKYVEVTGLSIPFGLDTTLFGSFPVFEDDKDYYPYRGNIFMFDDRSVLQYDGSVNDLSDPTNKTTFSKRVQKYWRDGKHVLTGIQFERCLLKSLHK
jgi:hypothetical protein